MNFSSDSEDTMILPILKEPSDSEVENILKKYVETSASSKNNCYNNTLENINENRYGENISQVNGKCKGTENYKITPFDMENLDLRCNIDCELENKLSNDIKLRKQMEIENKKKERALKKARKQQEIEETRGVKLLEKMRKKEKMDKQKLIQNALRTASKNTKPDECVKLLKESEVSEKQFLLIMNETEFMEYINRNNLTVHIENIYTLTKFKQLTVVIVGLEKLKPAQEMFVIEAQMVTKCYFRFVKKNEDLADLVIQLTKAVAQIPYKLKKEEKYKVLSEYFNDSNKDTVRIDKNGNGLNRLWHQMLSMFPLARLETAEAITAIYPTPTSLFQVYDTYGCKKEDLLQDLPIRRAQGPCILPRRIGPELSRKCFNFFCATENTFL